MTAALVMAAVCVFLYVCCRRCRGSTVLAPALVVEVAQLLAVDAVMVLITLE